MTEVEQAQLPVAPSLVRQAALRELETLASFVETLPTAAWSEPSASAGWTIGDVVAHLNLTLGVYNGVLEVAFRGWGGGTAWKTIGELTEKVVPAASPAINAINSTLPRLVKGALSPEVIKGQFAAGARRTRAKIERAGSENYTRPIHYMGRPWPLSFFLAAITNELAVHGWDMASRLDPHAHLGHEARAVLPWFYWGATPWMFRPASPFRGTVQATLRDPDFTMWWDGGASDVHLGTGQVDANATISGEAGTFVLVLAGRIKPDDAYRTTSISVEGNEDLARVFLTSWRII